MMPLYTEADFDKSLIPSHFKQDVRELIEVAAACGWKVHITGSQSVTIIAPEEKKKYHFGRRNSNSLNRVRRDIIRFGDPEKVMLMSALSKSDATTEMGKALERAAAATIPLLDENTIEDDRPETEAARSHGVNDEKPEPTIINERPMVAKAREGQGYDSPTTIERRWSDGSRDYKCVACDYTNPNRGSVPAHHGKAHPVTVRPTPYSHEVPDARVYKPRQSRIEALAEVLADAMAAGATDPQSIARESLLWVHEQTVNKTRHAMEAEPMSAEDALDRIRLLLDDGTMHEQRKRMEELEEKIVGLTEAVEVNAGEAAIWKGELDKAQQRVGELEAYIALGDELRKKAAG